MRTREKMQTVSKTISYPGTKVPCTLIVKYGMEKLGDQEPYFSITGEIRKRSGVMLTCGRLDEDIKKHLPELAELVPWCLTKQSGLPMHYAENSLYHFKNYKQHIIESLVAADEEGRQKALEDADKESDSCKRSMMFGKVDDDHLINFLGLDTNDMAKILEDRRPALNAAFRSCMERHNVEFI